MKVPTDRHQTVATDYIYVLIYSIPSTYYLQHHWVWHWGGGGGQYISNKEIEIMLQYQCSYISQRSSIIGQKLWYWNNEENRYYEDGAQAD